MGTSRSIAALFPDFTSPSRRVSEVASMSADFNKTEEGAAFPGSCNFRDNEQMVPDRVALDERWRRIEALFLDAADLPEAERAGFFDHACGGDIDLRREAESLM